MVVSEHFCQCPRNHLNTFFWSTLKFKLSSLDFCILLSSFFFALLKNTFLTKLPKPLLGFLKRRFRAKRSFLTESVSSHHSGVLLLSMVFAQSNCHELYWREQKSLFSILQLLNAFIIDLSYLIYVDWLDGMSGSTSKKWKPISSKWK